MTLDEFEKYISIAQAFVTIVSIIAAGIWAFRRYVVQQERYPNLNFTADINIIGKQGQETLVELIATVENKGKVQHKMNNITFELNALFANEPLVPDQRWRGQINFPHDIARGFLLPVLSADKKYFIDPGTTAKYSYISKLPVEAKYAVMHCSFNYSKRRKSAHTAEKTVAIPAQI